ncbi:hypothetical protein [Halobacteriaceae bacterium SHR40]|uniref:DEAD/DEAH box helicase n=1 Tax=Halovenus amylolytica TaxID=2500550 RepID=UPI000FE388CF
MTAGNPWDKVVDEDPVFKSSVLSDHDQREWPRRIDYVARRVADGEYVVGDINNQTLLSSGWDLEHKARDYYLEGIAALTGDRSRQTALPDDFDLGSLLVEFQALREGLADIEKDDIPPGEILSRLLTRTVQRQASGQRADLASQLRPDTETPRELVSELTTAPELADIVTKALPDTDDPETLTTELASLDLSTELWEHQLESLALWLHHGSNGYVDMATATGKTVLGLAAVAHTVDAGSLHPADQQRLEDIFDSEIPEPDRRRSNDILIVTTDDLLGIQWARLFQEHCHTPEEFTRITENGIQLPRMQIEIKSARSLDDIRPDDYGLAIFDEVHNYRSRSGWGDNLVSFIDSSCPVLALTGSVTDDFRAIVRQADRSFPVVYRYTHDRALTDGVIPDFEWTLRFTDVTEGSALDRLRDTAERFQDIITYDSGTLHVERSEIESVGPELDTAVSEEIVGSYTSGTALANKLRDVGDGESAPTEWLESLAKGLSDRTLDRLNLSADLTAVLTETERALASGRPTLVLTRTYGEAKTLWQELNKKDEDRLIKRLEAGASAETHASTIRKFDESDADKKVLIGPGKRIGQGNDIHSVEVGINIAKPGSGVNSTLVQRLGRLLRDAGSKDTVQFHHVMGVQPGDSAVEPDGESFVKTVSEFFGQVLEPDKDGILKPPSVNVEDTVSTDVAQLEQLGVEILARENGATILELAYAAAIDETPVDVPAVGTEWFSAVYGVTAEAQSMVTTSERETERSKEAGTERQTSPSPLAEHYDAFRSLGIIHRGLLNSGLDNLDETDPFKQWIEMTNAIVSEQGFGEQSAGYGAQLAETDAIDIDEYRDVHGDGKRVTDFETLSIREPPAAVLALIGDRFADLSTWHVPLTPDSETPLPVIVESDAELERASKLLEEFDPEPVDVVADENTEPPKIETPAETRPVNSETDESTEETPVAEVRGISSSTADTLSQAGYETLGHLQSADDAQLSAVDGISEPRVRLIRMSVGPV